MSPTPAGREDTAVGPLRRMLALPVPRAGATAGLIRVGGRLAAFGLQIFLARAIVDQAAFGLYAWGQNLLFLLGAVFAVGLPGAASRLVAVHEHFGDGATQRRVVRSTRGLIALFSAGFIALALAIISLVPTEDALARQTAVTAVVAAPLVSFVMLNQALARAQFRLVAAFLPNQVLRPLLTGLLALAVLLAADGRITAQQALGTVIGSLVLVIIIQHLLTGKPPGRSDDAAPQRMHDEYSSRQLLPNAMPIFATRLSELTLQHGGVLMLGLFIHPAWVAAYFVAERLARLVALPKLVVTAVIQPWLASAHAGDHREKMQEVVTQAVHTSLWPTLVGAVVVQAGAGVLLNLFGSGYGDAAPVLLVLMASHVISALLGPCQQILVMTGQRSVALRIAGTNAAVHMLLLALLIPAFGAMGAAWAVLISSLFAGVAGLVAVRNRLGIRASLLTKRTPARGTPETPQ